MAAQYPLDEKETLRCAKRCIEELEKIANNRDINKMPTKSIIPPKALQLLDEYIKVRDAGFQGFFFKAGKDKNTCVMEIEPMFLGQKPIVINLTKDELNSLAQFHTAQKNKNLASEWYKVFIDTAPGQSTERKVTREAESEYVVRFKQPQTEQQKINEDFLKAVKKGDVAAIKALFKNKNVKINLEQDTSSGSNITPLLAAIQRDNIEMVKELLKHGANVNATPTNQQSWGASAMTPGCLNEARKMGNKEIITAIEEQIEIDNKNKFKY